MKKLIPFVLLLLVCGATHAQNEFDRQDTLRGSITPERAWWTLASYDLFVDVDPDRKFISGKNKVYFKVIGAPTRMQIDLQAPMKITQVLFEGIEVKVEKDGSAHFLHLPVDSDPAALHHIDIHFEGHPKIANRPPWDGGFTWTTERKKSPFIATSNQGDGASLWWPCRDHPADEPDSMRISVRVPEGLMDVSNGSLDSISTHDDNDRTFHWSVKNPINQYGVNINIAAYETFSEQYEGLGGTLDCSYFVLKKNLKKAKKQFKQVARMLEAFEYWFGPYPFYEDGFKLVEVPYLGMEHQSSVTYGNHYKNGYLGTDLSQSGMGLLFDFIIIHEAGHEWFANNVTASDNADLWIHEGFTAYSENLYLDYHYGRDTSAAYVLGTRSRIQNDRPIQGPYGVNRSGSGDMYYKGANMLHTLRQIVDDDERWRQILRGINSTFRHQTITAKNLFDYINGQTEIDLTTFFQQYVQDVRIPVLEYRLFPGGVEYRWSQCVDGFEMPIDVTIDEKRHRLHANEEWKRLKCKSPKMLYVDENYYVASLKIR